MATLIQVDCTPQPPGFYPNDKKLLIAAACGPCCAVAGNPLPVCTPTTDDIAPTLTTADGKAVAGTLAKTAALCGGAPVYELNDAGGGILAPGSYVAKTSLDAMPLAAFEVTATGKSCQQPTDCATCSTCMSGMCIGKSLACSSNADCINGQICKIDAQFPCNNACIQPCSDTSPCGSCQTCVQGACQLSDVAKCTKDGDCAAGQVCAVNAVMACLNECKAPTAACKTFADCPTCQDCVAGVCGGMAPLVCSTDFDCGGGKTCQKSSKGYCFNTCGAAAPGCTTASDCPACQLCSGGSCYLPNIKPLCTTDTDCGAGQTCSVQKDAPCQNACVGGGNACKTDQDCGSCGKCSAGQCSLAAAGCKSDAECGANMVCKPDPKAPCSNVCGFKACATDGDCPPCVTCMAGSCTGMGIVACNADGDCGWKKKCLKDAASPCANKCVDSSGCESDMDCGVCGKCTAGACTALPVACVDDAGCGPKQACVVAGGSACLNKCVTLPDNSPDVVDAGPDAGAEDAGSVDAGSEDAGSVDAGADVAPAPDAILAGTDAVEDQAAPDADADALDVSEPDAPAKPDEVAAKDAKAADPDAEDAAEEVAVADAEAPADVEPSADLGTETPPVATRATSSCTAAPGSHPNAGALVLFLALSAAALVRRRKS